MSDTEDYISETHALNLIAKGAIAISTTDGSACIVFNNFQGAELVRESFKVFKPNYFTGIDDIAPLDKNSDKASRAYYQLPVTDACINDLRSCPFIPRDRVLDSVLANDVAQIARKWLEKRTDVGHENQTMDQDTTLNEVTQVENVQPATERQPEKKRGLGQFIKTSKKVKKPQETKPQPKPFLTNELKQSLAQAALIFHAKGEASLFFINKKVFDKLHGQLGAYIHSGRPGNFFNPRKEHHLQEDYLYEIHIKRSFAKLLRNEDIVSRNRISDTEVKISDKINVALQLFSQPQEDHELLSDEQLMQAFFHNHTKLGLLKDARSILFFKDWNLAESVTNTLKANHQSWLSENINGEQGWSKHMTGTGPVYVIVLNQTIGDRLLNDPTLNSNKLIDNGIPIEIAEIAQVIDRLYGKYEPRQPKTSMKDPPTPQISATTTSSETTLSPNKNTIGENKGLPKKS